MRWKTTNNHPKVWQFVKYAITLRRFFGLTIKKIEWQGFRL